MSWQRATIGLAAAIALLVGAQAALADGYFDQGKRLYDQKKFRDALPYFHKSAQDQPWDSTSAYYEALCYHMTRDYKNAAIAYANVVEHFPGSAAYVNAAAALKVLDPSYFTRQHDKAAAASGSGTSAAAGANSDDRALLEKVQVNAPNESKIPVKRSTDKNWVSGQINGHSVTFDFSVDGDNTTISAKDAAKMSLPVANGRAMVSVSVGQISEYNFPLKVADTDRPRLGTDFFHRLNYRLGPTEIDVTKTAAGAYDLRFTKSGSALLVNVRINGRGVNAVFDPEGGQNLCPRNRTRELGLDVEDKQEVNMVTLQNPGGALRGQPGFGEVKQISSAQAKVMAVGPVGTGNSFVNFHIDDKAKDVVITPSIFAGWQYDIDEANKLIHFRRR